MPPACPAWTRTTRVPTADTPRPVSPSRHDSLFLFRKAGCPVTALLGLAALVLPLALAARSRRLSLLAGILCVVVGYYLAASGTATIMRQEITDALSFAVGHFSRLIPDIAS